MKIRVSATELVDAEVDFISLVKHGANRKPYKIVKSEEQRTPKTLQQVIDDFRALVEPALSRQQAPKRNRFR